jgi:DNA repair protein RecN (Recombination protein N)
MLTHIQIRDFAIIDSIELEFDAGMTVLSGETGAGKSILVDALLLAAGGRAGAEVVRAGTERAEVAATFAVAGNTAAEQWLSEQSVDHDGECLLRRVVGVDGRSRAYVNGQAMPLQAIRQLGELVVDVHGQMEYQSLMRRGAQRDLLDAQGGNQTLLTATRESWQRLQALRKEREAAAASANDRAARQELLTYHVAELDALDLKEEEVGQITEEQQRLSQGGRLAAGSREIAELLRESEESNAEQALGRALSVARNLAGIDSRVEPAARLLDEALISAREAIDEILRYESNLEADPTRQEWVEQRLAAIEDLARKHRVEVTQLLCVHETLKDELQRLRDLHTTLEGIDTTIEQAAESYRKVCRQLSAKRAETARRLGERVTRLMQELGMPGGQFAISVTPLDDDAQSASGADDIEFTVSANPGQPLRPLAKVASGGELSRISLAVQVAAVERTAMPCLVFDEVDAGVGGAVAEIVGRQLRALGEHAQVLCVTHLPQVASQAHAQVRVTKLTDGHTTRTTLAKLQPDERVAEIARMLGGTQVTDKAREHAREMLGLAHGATRAQPPKGKRKTNQAG